MVRSGIKDLKHRLSHDPSIVREGKEVIITDRGKPVARIICEHSPRQSIRMALHPLVQEGLLTLPTRDTDRDIPQPVKTDGKLVSEMVIGDRR